MSSETSANSADDKSSTRTVLVSFNERRRPVTFQGGKAGLIEAFKAAFVDVLNPLHSKLVLQIQDHNWGGAYIDLLDQDIPDRSYVKVIAEEDAAEKHDASSQVSLWKFDACLCVT